MTTFQCSHEEHMDAAKSLGCSGKWLKPHLNSECRHMSQPSAVFFPRDPSRRPIQATPQSPGGSALQLSPVCLDLKNSLGNWIPTGSSESTPLKTNMSSLKTTFVQRQEKNRRTEDARLQPGSMFILFFRECMFWL